ncbi:MULTISPECIES: PQQ-dependent sugar dehydrogenase [Methylophaga]|uniref:PQQ-dependent sugar dehydrogenase n=1 Tax=Methylophaga TaxID=40222 RepID=UPI00235758A6|nr:MULTISPECIES: PQQ-dependent sugar dehydrogenase [Methylophaga]
MTVNLVKTLSAFAFLISSSFVAADISRDKDLNIEKILSDIPVAWGMDYLSDNVLLISQRDGHLYQFHQDTKRLHEITGLPVDILVQGQGGLFDVKRSPDYEKTGWIYLSYAKDVDDEGATSLARAKIENNTLTHWQELLVTQSRTGNDVHYGGRITFDGNGHIFLSVGERGERPNAQNLMTHAGTILRLNMDGTAPADNPFIGKNEALPEIWSYGHRNPQGLFYNQQTQQLWEIEHGPRGGDEINLIEAGKNYGWPEISYGKEYWAPLSVGHGTHEEGMEQPIKTYIPSIAPSSLIQYQGTLFPEWRGKLIIGALSLQHLNIVSLNDKNEATDEQRLLNTLSSRIRNVIETPDGALLISSDSGDIYRISPKTE